jgi:hypothetical protein
LESVIVYFLRFFKGDTAQGSLATMKVLFEKISNVKIVLLTAPSIPITFHGGKITTAWHDFENIENEKFVGIDTSKDLSTYVDIIF